jgi:hypothetical protein
MKLPLIPSTILARLTIWVWGAYAIWQGLGIVIDGPVRFASPAFTLLRAVPYPTLVWGWSLTVSGVLLLAGSLMQPSRRPRMQFVGLFLKGAGCIGIGIWSVIIAIGAFNARQDSSTYPGTVGRTYIAVAVSVLILMFIDERKQGPVNGGGP